MPTETQRNEIFDNEGVPYWVFVDKDEKFVQLTVTTAHRNLPVGLARYWIRSPEEIELDDIYIFDETFKPEPLWLAIVRWVFCCPQCPQNYQRKGIGTSLLEFIIQHTKKGGASYITGFIASEKTDTGVLVRWYEGLGFEVDTSYNLPRLRLNLKK